MESPVAPQQNKKLLIGILAGFGLFLIIVMFTIISTTPTGKKEVAVTPQKPSTENTAARDNQGALPTPVVSTIPFGWKEYKSSLYSLNIPSDWKAEETRLPSGGSAVKIRPLTASADLTSPSFIIIADSISSVPSVKQKQQAFVALGLKSDSVLVDTLQATRLKGALSRSSKQATSPAGSSGLQITHIFLDKGNYSYLLDFTYSASGFNPQLEEKLTTIVSSFKFAKSTVQ